VVVNGAGAVWLEMRFSVIRPLIVAAGLSLFVSRCVRADAPCVYMDNSGSIVSVRKRELVPSEFRNRLVCGDKTPGEIAVPEQLKLGSDVRRATFSTDVGAMHVRWPRAVERCFASSPSRAVGEAAQALNRALKNGRFSSEVKYSNREWSLAFVDKQAAFSQFPIALSLGGHPGLMIPPSNIYIITDFVAPDCAQGVVGDAALTQVLLHEMGHVVEYGMLGGRDDLFDRQRAEGFAVWFERYSADFSSLIPRGSVARQYDALLATERSVPVGSSFSGSPSDYARAALPFQAIVARRGIAGLMKVYQVMRDDGLLFHDAVSRGLGWSRETLERESYGVDRVR
jgi:hypothetical protein